MSNAYHIAHVLPFPAVGGVEIGALRLMQGARERGWRNTAFYIEGATAVARHCAAAGFAVTEFEPVEPSYRRPRAYLQNAWQLARQFKRQGVTLVHCQDLLAAYLAAPAGKLAGVPVLCHIRAQRPEIAPRERGLLLAVDHFAFVSRDSWTSFGHRVSPQRGTVIYDGFDFVDVDASEARQSVRREFGLADDARIIGTVARVARQKDFETLVRAAARVVAVVPQARFLIVGDHTSQSAYRAYYDELQGLLAAAGLAGHFVFTGQRQDVVRLLAAMEVCVLCTHTEGLPLALLEAMAQGKPVVATAVGGVPEFVADGATGLLHKHQDEAELACHLLALLNDRARAAGLGAAARQLIAAQFNPARTITALTNLYGEMLASGRGANTFALSRAGEVTEGGD